MNNLVFNCIQQQLNIPYMLSISQIVAEALLTKAGLSKAIICVIILFL
jgi:hypothetical protein